MKKLIREKEDKMTGHKWTAEQKEKFLKTAEAKRVLRKEESGKSILAEIAHNKALEDLDRSSQAEKMAMNQDACLKMIDPQVRGLPSREIRLITIFCLKCGHQMQLNPDEFQK